MELTGLPSQSRLIAGIKDIKKLRAIVMEEGTLRQASNEADGLGELNPGSFNSHLARPDRQITVLVGEASRRSLTPLMSLRLKR